MSSKADDSGASGASSPRGVKRSASALDEGLESAGGARLKTDGGHSGVSSVSGKSSSIPPLSADHFIPEHVPEDDEDKVRELEQKLYEVLGPYTSHFNTPECALLYLAQQLTIAKPHLNRNWKLSIPKPHRVPKSSSGRGGYAECFFKLGLKLREQDTKSGHWHSWYVDPKVINLKALRAAIIKRWKETPSYSDVAEQQLAQNAQKPKQEKVEQGLWPVMAHVAGATPALIGNPALFDPRFRNVNAGLAGLPQANPFGFPAAQFAAGGAAGTAGTAASGNAPGTPTGAMNPLNAALNPQLFLAQYNQMQGKTAGAAASNAALNPLLGGMWGGFWPGYGMPSMDPSILSNPQFAALNSQWLQPQAGGAAASGSSATGATAAAGSSAAASGTNSPSESPDNSNSPSASPATAPNVNLTTLHLQQLANQNLSGAMGYGYGANLTTPSAASVASAALQAAASKADGTAAQSPLYKSAGATSATNAANNGAFTFNRGK